ncbi:MAG: hypothetical protein ACXW4E_10965, partial [Anaerolineales bacterium]
YDVDPQTGMPLDGFYIFNQDKLDNPQDFKQQITFDQIKFHVGQPDTTIEVFMDYPPFDTTEK